MKKPLLITVFVLAASALTFMFVRTDATQGPALVQWDAKDEVLIQDEESGEESGTAMDRRELAAQSDRAAPTDEEANRPLVTLRGRVINGFKQPVENAQVLLELRRPLGGPFGGGGRGNRQQIRKPVVTGKDGTFAFQGRGYPLMTVSLSLSHSQFAATQVDRELGQATAEIDLGDLEILDGGQLAGLVLDLDGNPIPGATVRAEGGGGIRMLFAGRDEEKPLETTVDAAGRYFFTHLPAGEYRLQASAPRKLRASSEAISLAEDTQETVDTLRLGPGQVLSGTVFAPTGKPVQGAEVAVFGGNQRGQDQRTGVDGRFEFDHLLAQPVTVRVTASSFVTYAQSGVTPGGPSLVVNLMEGLKIAGIALDALTGSPVTKYGARVQRIGGLPDSSATAQTTDFDDLRNSFRQARERMGQVNLNDPEQARQLEAMRGQLEAAASRMRDLAESGAIEGRRRGEGGGGQGGNRGERGGERPTRGDRGQTGATNRGNQRPGEVGEIVDRPGGRFSFTGLDEGVYVVDIGSPDHQRVRSTTVTLRAGQPPAELTIALPRGVHLSGSVITSGDQMPIANAEVDLVMVEENSNNTGRGSEFMAMMMRGMRGQSVASEKTDRQGKFTFKHLAPGRYQVRARADRHATKTSSAMDLADDQAGLVLDLGALASLAGRVTGIPAGKEAEARVVAFAGMQNLHHGAVKPDGSYSFTELQPGNYMIRAYVGETRQLMAREFSRMRGGNRGGETPTEPQFDVTLKEGEQKSLNLVALTFPVGSVSGFVNKNGAAGRGLRVTVRSQPQAGSEERAVDFMGRGGGGQGGRGGRFGGATNQALVDSQGNFKIGDLAEGAYIIEVQGSGRGGQQLHQGTLYVRADADTRYDIAILTGSAEVEVVDEKGALLTNLNGSVSLQARSADAATGGALRSNIPIRGGKGRVEELATGDFKTMPRFSSHEAPEQEVQILSGTPTKLRITAKPRAATAPSQTVR